VQPHWLDGMRNFVFDSYQRASPARYDPDVPVRVVGIDEESLQAFGQWPWPRSRLAELADRLRELGAGAVAFDFIFPEPDRVSLENIGPSIADPRARAELARIVASTPGNDLYFSRALRAGSTVLGMTLTASGAPPPQKAGFVFAGDNPDAFLHHFGGAVAPLPLLVEATQGLGATNWLPDRDQVVRQALLVATAAGKFAPSLAIEALRVAQGESTFIIRSSNASGETAFGSQTGVNAVKVGAFEVATGARGEVRPRYSGAQPARNISAAAVLRGEVDRSRIEGRIVFVGALAAGLGDIRATPLEAAVPGVDIHAQILESLFSGALLSRPDWAAGLEFLAALAAFFAAGAALYFAPPFFSAAAGVTMLGALLYGSYYLFDRLALLLNPAFPSLAIVWAYLVGAVALWRIEQTSRRNVRKAFGKFVAPAVVDRLAENPERLVLGGETRELTVLFSDMRDFSSMSEGMSARELTSFMNDYLTPMTDAILECEGTVDKYMGDAILAFWNAPLEVPDHPRKAVMAALRMRAALADFNKARVLAAQAEGRERRVTAMGLGLHLGPCSVGNMGSLRRFDYSILGDTVNVSSRLDTACKFFKLDIIASRAVRDAAPEFAWLDLGQVIVLGRSAPTGIATLAGDATFAATKNFQTWRERHDAALSDYEAARFDTAAKTLRLLAESVASPWRAYYVALERRLLTLAAAPAQDNWSSVWSLDSK
jgi:adenylate cyclase